MDLTQPLILILFLIIDLIIIAKPFLGFLNIVTGFFTVLLTMLTIPDLTFMSASFRSYFVVFMVVIGLITMIRGIQMYLKPAKKKGV